MGVSVGCVINAGLDCGEQAVTSKVVVTIKRVYFILLFLIDDVATN